MSSLFLVITGLTQPNNHMSETQKQNQHRVGVVGVKEEHSNRREVY